MFNCVLYHKNVLNPELIRQYRTRFLTTFFQMKQLYFGKPVKKHVYLIF